MILLPHFDIPYGFGLGKIPSDLPFQGPVFFGQLHKGTLFEDLEMAGNSNPRYKISKISIS